MLALQSFYATRMVAIESVIVRKSTCIAGLWVFNWLGIQSDSFIKPLFTLFNSSSYTVDIFLGTETQKSTQNVSLTELHVSWAW